YEDRGLDYPIGYVRWTQQRNMSAILGLQARGRLTFADLIDDVVPVADAADAYGRLVGEPELRPKGALVLSYGAEEEPFRSPAPSRVSRLRPAASKTAGQPRVGLIGPGAFATSVIVPALTAAGAKLELVGGGSGPSAIAAQRDFGFVRVAASEQALVSDPDLDAVVIATRHGTHAQLAREALEHGKHVFVEKPLALTVEDVHSVIEAAAASSGILAVGFNRRFSPLFVRLRDHLRHTGGPLTASFRVSAGSIPSKHWVHDLAEGGGRALGEVCHFVDTLAALTGSNVTEVHAIGYGDPELPAQAHDNLAITLRFADGSVGTIVYVSHGSPGVGKERLEAFSGSRTGILDDFVGLQLFDGGAVSEERLKLPDKGHRAELAAFVDGIRRGVEPVPLAEVENVSIATIGVVESLRSGRPVGVGS
ncbi:MAG: hypothetical protein QOF37_2426, partial [Thermoleophilaceae bacterium]|nr:hypothetical protein [Thermoleophilaceae bacterium]